MSTMTEDTTYNGWKNYPTWAVNLWLSNDEGLYGATRHLVETTITTAKRSEWDDAHRVHVADALKSFVRDDLAPDLGASFAADLLGYALDSVNWLEIADAWLEMANED
jgi:hypothetical protein